MSLCSVQEAARKWISKYRSEWSWLREKNGHDKKTTAQTEGGNYVKIKAVMNFTGYNQPLLSVDELKSLFFFTDNTRNENDKRQIKPR